MTTRDDLVEAAVELFRTQGVSGSGVDAICRRAGVTKGVFSHHFPGGKKTLVQAAVERNAADVRALIARLHERTEGVPDLVLALFDAYAKLFHRYGWAHGCPVAATAVESGLDATLADAAAAGFRSWREQLGELGLEPATAALVVATVEGAILQARVERDSTVFHQVGGRLAEFLAHEA